MSDEDASQNFIQFGVAATLLRQYAAEQRDFLAMLASLLQRVVPEATEVHRRGGWFAQKTIQGGTVPLGENRYTLEDTGHGSLQASCTRIVRGIALKTERITVQDWLQALGAFLDECARTSAAARDALARFVGW